MKKLISLLLSTLIIFVLSSCNENTVTKQKREILTDTTFENGLAISQLLSKNTATTWWKYNNTADSSVQPNWSLGQYCDLSSTRNNYDSTKNDLSLGTMFEEGLGIESNIGSIFQLTNQSGSKTIKYNKDLKTVSLNADTSKEYVNSEGSLQARTSGEDWLHMILGQSAGGIYINNVEEIWVELEFTLTENMQVDTSIGASQFQWIFSIKDYESIISDYYWFNITIFDNRYDTIDFSGTSMYDSGKEDATGKFIYAPAGNKYLTENIEIGKTYKINMNFKPLIIEAFNEAKAKGALEQSKLENMALNSLNIGWEVSNIAKVGIDISKISLSVVDKD
jgi:hypothetical protein